MPGSDCAENAGDYREMRSRKIRLNEGKGAKSDQVWEDAVTRKNMVKYEEV